MSVAVAEQISQPTATQPSATHWRWAGGLTLAYIVALFGSLPIEGGVMLEHGAAPSKVQQVLSGANLDRLFAGLCGEVLAFFFLVAAVTILARALGARTSAGRWIAPIASGLATVWAGSTIAIGFAPLIAAAYGAHHGVDPAVLATVNDLRNYSFVFQVSTAMAMTLALGATAIAGHTRTRVVGWAGVVIGVVGLVLTPSIPDGQNLMSMIQTVWMLVVAIACLKGSPGSE